MYGYQEHIELTPEQLLQKITQQEIFESVLQLPFNFGMRYCSPFREDKKPGCRFEERPDGTIVFVDFGEKFLTGHTHRSCFGMVMDLYNVGIGGAILAICSKFGLSTNPKDYTPVIKSSYEVVSNNSQDTIITYQEKFPVKSDVQFWSQYLIKMEHLKEDNNFSIRQFTVKNNKGTFVINTFKYSYVFDFIHQRKIYQPYNVKYKWISNCDENCIGNIDNLPLTGKELIIQKSYKDHRVLRNLDLGLNVIWFQNEGCVPDLTILKNLTERFELITIFFDNDDDGILAAQKLVEVFNSLREGCVRMIYLPKKRKHKQLHGMYLKDPGDFIHKEGRQDLIKVLKQIGINGKDT